MFSKLPINNLWYFSFVSITLGSDSPWVKVQGAFIQIVLLLLMLSTIPCGILRINLILFYVYVINWIVELHIIMYIYNLNLSNAQQSSGVCLELLIGLVFLSVL